jgi:transcription initiation factor IIF auxiliary subunit
MHIQQSEEYVGDNYWNWSVWIEGSPEEIETVTLVEWRLHPTFSNPIRLVTDKTTNFRLDTSGWGVFLIHASVSLEGGGTQKLQHYLQLHYPDGVSGVSGRTK